MQGCLTRAAREFWPDGSTPGAEGVLARPSGVPRLDHPRMDRVDPHPIALASEFEGRRFGEQGDTTLGQRIKRVVLRADEPGNRGEVDDGAAMRALPGALAQGRQRVLGAEKHPGQVDGAEPMPFLEARLLDTLA